MANSWWVVNFHHAFTANLGGLPLPGISPPGEHLSSVVQAASAADAGNQIKAADSGAVIDSVQGPYATQADAQAAESPQQIGATSPAGAAQAVASSIGQTFLGPLFQKNLWLRVGEVVVGLILIGIGLNAMLKGKPLAVVTNTVGNAAKTAALALWRRAPGLS